MTIEQAIYEAIDGGWKPSMKYDPLVLWLDDGEWEFNADCYLLDPLFWQYFGKAMGWDTEWYSFGDDQFYVKMKPWLVKMHNFIDHIANGRTPKQFFEEL